MDFAYLSQPADISIPIVVWGGVTLVVGLAMSYGSFKLISWRWPHANALWRLIAFGFTATLLGVIAVYIVSQLSLPSQTEQWAMAGAVAIFLAGITALFASLCWQYILQLIYPIDPGVPVGSRPIRWGSIARAASILAVTPAFPVGALASLASGPSLGIGAAIAVFLLVFLVALLVLNRALRKRTTGT